MLAVQNDAKASSLPKHGESKQHIHRQTKQGLCCVYCRVGIGVVYVEHQGLLLLLLGVGPQLRFNGVFAEQESSIEIHSISDGNVLEVSVKVASIEIELVAENVHDLIGFPPAVFTGVPMVLLAGCRVLVVVVGSVVVMVLSQKVCHRR